ncbi:MAG TPA: MBL fold metallo-hydrolase [Oscillospiraceae bacterium]|nr:MBL fold metallo-hydrolase [Oscillospiraceae bacterium]HPS35925.1 MBL fold metallo-hydrolase [Oscillospiraceae bacterium]
MKITFIGADHEVTGSCTYLEAAGKRFLVDCGMEQGPNQFENQEIPVADGTLDFMLLTHAHIDHSGLIPLLYKNGFRGKIYCSDATAALCRIMLRDCAHIQEFEAEWRNRKAKRADDRAFEPLYTMEDAEGSLTLFETCGYRETVNIYEGIEFNLTDAGHLLGSSSIRLTLTENGMSRSIIFSGDIGNINQPLVNDPQYPAPADYVVTESTYGNRTHEPPPDYAKALAEIIDRTFSRGGNVVIPSFAIGRTQEMLYFIRRIKSEGLTRYPNFRVIVDSPLAIEATGIFANTDPQYFDEETRELHQKGIDPIKFDGLQTTVTSDDSRQINTDTEPKVIISASGMCEAGRIRHHLKHNLWRKECSIVFVGYQAVGTLGRILLDGEKNVKLFGEEIAVKADIVNLPGISGHADENELLKWITQYNPAPKKVFVNHGDNTVCEEYRDKLRSLGLDADTPYSGTTFDLLSERYLYLAQPVSIDKKQPAAAVSTVFDRLVSAGKRLAALINAKKGMSNKDLAKFADQINALTDKWEK